MSGFHSPPDRLARQDAILRVSAVEYERFRYVGVHSVSITFLKATSAYALWGNVCLAYKNQKPKSLDTADVVRDVVNSVAVEKLPFHPKLPTFGYRKCPGDPRESFIGHPDAILFSRLSREGVFQQPRLIATVTALRRSAWCKVMDWRMRGNHVSWR